MPVCRHSTWPPTYVSDSSRWPPYEALVFSTCLLGQIMLPRYASTMSSDSHSVPEPLRSTSSGLMGMTVASEKMKPCTYFMYK